MSIVLHRCNIEARLNADIRQSFTLADTDDDPIDVTGAAFTMSVKNENGTEVLLLTTGNGRIDVSDGPNGVVSIAVVAADLASISPGVYDHDLLMVLDGETSAIWFGTITFEQGVS